LLVQEAASAEEVPLSADIGSIFVGRYTDPNHPGGFRKIFLTDTWKDDVRQVRVEGGGGRGEPPSYTLRGFAGRKKNTRGEMMDFIVIDFSPKGGPPNFAGVWDKDGITFLRDGNHWPKK